MATIYYHDIGDYLSREQKLKMVRDFRSIKSMEWTKIVPNEKGDWINQRDGAFDSLVLMGNKDDKENRQQKFFNFGHTNGIKTQRDVWCYNFSVEELRKNMSKMIDFYNQQREMYHHMAYKNVDDFIDTDDKKISWTLGLKRDLANDVKGTFYSNTIRDVMYRPYMKIPLYCDEQFNEVAGIKRRAFPTGEYNLCINICGVGSSKDFSCLVTKMLPDIQLMFNGQCFPLYYYEENTHKQKTLFDDTSDDDYIRHDGITDWILKEVRNRYNGAKNITKEMIFYYVYGLLHSKDYRERFAADLKKSLPRIPIVDRIEDFMAFYKAGKQLAELHLNYEEVPPHPEVVVHITAQRADQDDYDYFRVDPKMKFRSKDDKSVILYNSNIRLENIPLKAYDYIVNGKSAIEWIVERYCVSIDKKSLIKNDANDWAREHGKPRYILDLLLSVINVSTQTVDIVNNLPHLTFD